MRPALPSRLAAALLPAIVFFAPLAPASDAVAATGATLRVMSFNIRYGTARDAANHWLERRDLVFRVLRDHRPELIGLQEALAFQIREIREAFPEYRSVGVGRDDGLEAGEHAAILYLAERFDADEEGTFWLSDTPEVPGSMSWGNSITRICTWARFRTRGDSVPFFVYNLHLDHQSQRSRELAIELLAARIARRAAFDPVIVTGDFNAGEQNRAILFLTGALSRAHPEAEGVAPPSPRLRDTYRVLHPDATEVGTFHGFRGAKSGAKIDFILAPAWVDVLEASIIHDASDGRYPSDHFPVFARLWVPRVRES
jgi:endonuclease/exonuclease/phosphatase family metal-dependent hydrolase